MVRVGKWLLGVASAGAILAGCAHYRAEPLNPRQVVAEFESRQLSDPALRAFLETNHMEGEWPRRSWDLSALTLAALYYHPDLDTARAKWAVAKAGLKSAGERPNPTLSVTPGYNSTTGTPSPWFVTPALDLPIETAGKRGYRVAQAAHLSEAARLEIASVAWQVRARLRKTWVAAYQAVERRRLLLEQQATRAQMVQFIGAQLAAGAVSAVEVTQSRLALDHTGLALRDVEGQWDELRVQMAAAIGIPTGELDPSCLCFPAMTNVPPALPSAEARRQALLGRSDVLAALADYAARESALRLEIAKQYPDIHFNPGYEYDQGDNKWTLGLSMTLPILSQNRGAIAEAEARRAESAAQFNALQARVLGEIDRATSMYRSALAKAATADALLAGREKQERAARARLEFGEISKLELALGQLEVNQAALDRLDAWVQVQQALGEMENALQAPADDADALRTVFRRSEAETKDHKR